MTTPMRYEEMARAWLTKKYGRIDSFSYQGGPTSADADDLEEVISTAAREAQIRVLQELRDVAQSQETAAGRRACVVRVLEMIDRLESGEDL